MVTIERLTEVSETLAADLSKLSTTLHGGERSVTAEELEEIVRDTSIVLMVARDGEKVVGMAAIYLIKKIGNRKAYIEDVIVDEGYRSQGIGGTLMQALIDAARTSSARSLELATRMDRKNAHRFYEKLGFKKKDRYVYKLEL